MSESENLKAVSLTAHLQPSSPDALTASRTADIPFCNTTPTRETFLVVAEL